MCTTNLYNLIQRVQRVCDSSGIPQSDSSLSTHYLWYVVTLRRSTALSNQPIASRASRRVTECACWRCSGSWTQWNWSSIFRSEAVVGDEQRRRGMHWPEAGVRPVLQPLVRREVPEGGPERRPLHRDLPEVPAVRAEGHQGEGHPDRRSRVHGPQQGQARELMEREQRQMINTETDTPYWPLSVSTRPTEHAQKQRRCCCSTTRRQLDEETEHWVCFWPQSRRLLFYFISLQTCCWHLWVHSTWAMWAVRLIGELKRLVGQSITQTNQQLLELINCLSKENRWFSGCDVRNCCFLCCKSR